MGSHKKVLKTITSGKVSCKVTVFPWTEGSMLQFGIESITGFKVKSEGGLYLNYSEDGKYERGEAISKLIEDLNKEGHNGDDLFEQFDDVVKEHVDSYLEKKSA